MKVILYKYENKEIIVDKSSYLQSPYTITGEVPEVNQNMEKPSLYFKFTSEPDYNYAYVEEWHRYYYVTNKNWIGGDVWQFDFAVDELYTYKALILSLSGIVKYSIYGSMKKHDPRLNFNALPIRSELTPLDPDNNDATLVYNGGLPLIMLRYYSAQYNSSITPPDPPASMHIVYMTPTSYMGFLQRWYDMIIDPNREQIAVAIGSSIIDVTTVYYYGSVATLTSDLDIVFDAPAVVLANNNAPYTIAAKPRDDSSLALCGAYHVYTVTDHDNLNEFLVGKKFKFPLTLTYYWQVNAAHTINLPFIGTLKLDLSNAGIGFNSTVNLIMQVKHDPWENAYVITFSYNNTELFMLRSISPVTTTLAFPEDKSFENAYMTNIMKAASLLANGAGTASLALGTGAMFGMGRMGGLIGDALGTGIEMDKLAVQSALSLTYKGVTGGSPDCVLPRSTVYMEIVTTYPAADYLNFWVDHGFPDGAYRALNTLTGFVQMQEFEMIYDSNATRDEMQRLEQQLYKGVIL